TAGPAAFDPKLLTRAVVRGPLPMAKRDNHYEAEFEADLRWLGGPYIAFHETHRSLLGGTSLPAERSQDRPSLKSIDFVVSPAERAGNWLVDVKGRRFPRANTY